MELAPAVVCFDGMGINALATVRSLGRRHIPVYTLAMKGNRGIASESRYCTAHIEVSDEAALPYSLTRLAENLGRRPILYIDNDAMMRALTPHASALTRYFDVVEPIAMAQRLTDKSFQLRAAAQAGIPVPGTWFPGSWEDVSDIGRQTTKRLIAKPAPGQSHVGVSFKALIGASAADLATKLRRLGVSPQGLLLQEYVEGTDAQIHVAICYRAADKRSFLLSARKLRQTPPRAGVMAVGEATDNPEVRDMTRRLADALDLRGVLSAEFKLDPTDGRFYFIEWNPRPAYFQSIGWQSGFDLAYLAYCDHVDPRRLPAEAFANLGRHYWINARGDLQHLSMKPWLALMPRTWAPYFGVKEWAVFARDDPRPWLSAMKQLSLMMPMKLTGWFADRCFSKGLHRTAPHQPKL